MVISRMEREKQELRDYLEKDSKAMRDRMSQEEEERARKEQEMKVQMHEKKSFKYSGAPFRKTFLSSRIAREASIQYRIHTSIKYIHAYDLRVLSYIITS